MLENVKKFLKLTEVSAPVPAKAGFTVSEVETILAATGSSVATARDNFASIADEEGKAGEALAAKISSFHRKIQDARLEKESCSRNLSEANALLKKLG